VSARLLLAALPAGALLLTAYAVRPRGPVAGARRLALARAVLLVGVVGVGSVELLSAAGALDPAGALGTWTAVAAASGAAAALRRWRDLRARAAEPERPAADRSARAVAGWSARAVAGWSARWRALPRADRLLFGVVGGLVAAELVLALASPPNTYDSQTYHLPRIERWIAQGSVEFYATAIHRQVTYPPGAEYLLTHLRLLTGSDRLHGLLQWGAGLACLLLAGRIAAQLGAGRRGQLLTAFVLGTAPLVVLESSSTQTDLVVAAAVAALAKIVLDGVGAEPARRPGPVDALLLGGATGLIALTKGTGLLAAAPLLLWWGLARLRRLRGVPPGRAALSLAGTAAATMVVLGLGSAIYAPYAYRMYDHFGHVLGPDYLRTSISMERHDPAALLVNAARQAHTLFDTPIGPLHRAGATGVGWLADAVGVDPSDPAITFDHATFPEVAWYPPEDKAAFPLQALLATVGTLALLARPGGTLAGRRRAYALCVIGGLLLFVALLKWQPWGNRLLLFGFVLAAPLAGVWLARLLPDHDAAPTPAADAPPAAAPPGDAPPSDAPRADARPSDGVRRARPALAAVVVAVLALGAVAGALSAAYGWPRRLVGSDSALLLDDWRGRFVTRPGWADDYAVAAEAVRRSGARRVGLVQQNDTWEYPWWVQLRGRQFVPLQSQLRPRIEPGWNNQVDAIVCAAPADMCREYSPPGWVVRTHGAVSWSLPT
jgi:hypothetical protein